MNQNKLKYHSFWRKVWTGFAVLCVALVIATGVSVALDKQTWERCQTAEVVMNAGKLCGQDKLCMTNPDSYQKWMEAWMYHTEHCDEREASEGLEGNVRDGRQEPDELFTFRPRGED